VFTREYAVKMQGPQMVRDQKKLWNHWIRPWSLILGCEIIPFDSYIKLEVINQIKSLCAKSLLYMHTNLSIAGPETHTQLRSVMNEMQHCNDYSNSSSNNHNQTCYLVHL